MRKTTSVFAVMLVGLLSIGLVSAFHGFDNSETKEAIKQAVEDDDYDTWKELMATAVLSEERFQKMKERHEKHEAVREAIEAEDYDAWVAAHGDHPLVDKVSEEDFPRIIEIHEAKDAGDFKTARILRGELFEELGIEPPPTRRGH